MDKHKILLRASILGILFVVAKEQAAPIIQNIVLKRDEEEKHTFNISDFITNHQIINVSGTTIAVGVLPKLY